jgi:TolA-binding protein
MSEQHKELAELKKEVVAARNQAIKTDNQVCNIAIDIRAFEKRFEQLERRIRLASLGAHVVVAMVITFAAWMVLAIRGSRYEEHLAEMQNQVSHVTDESDTRRLELNERLRAVEDKARLNTVARNQGTKVLAFLEANRDDEAAQVLLALQTDHLTPLEQKLTEDRFSSLRRRASEAAYKEGRTLLGRAKTEQGIERLKTAIDLLPDGNYSEKARYLLGTTLYDMKAYDQAEVYLRKLKEQTKERAVIDETRFLLGATLARLGRQPEARTELTLAAQGGRFKSKAENYLHAIDSGSALPPLRPKR